MLIIGLGHKKAVGKDECAKVIKTLADTVSLKATIGSMSGPLMDAAYEMFGYLGVKKTEVYDYEYYLKDQPLPGLISHTPRDLWKLLGTLARSVEQDALLKQVVWKAKQRDVKLIVIPNVRFPNEATALKELGGLLFRIDRKSVPQDTTDPFDTALDSWQVWDGIIENDGTLEQWREKCADFFGPMIKNRG